MFLMIAAMLANGIIALVLYWWLGKVRVAAVARRQVALKDIALSKSPWSDQAKKINNALENQFQLPVLFYVGCAISVWLGPIWLEIVLAWLFVVSRVVHAVIHTTHNNVRQRFAAFSVGFVLIVFLWADLIVHSALHMGAVI